MSDPAPVRVHLVVGGYPPGSHAAHDMDYARRQLLGLLGERANALTTVSSDFADLERWLPQCQLLVTYVAGPHLNAEQSRFVADWLGSGGRWLGLHGTSGGRAAPVDGNRRVRRMVKTEHHQVLGSFFLNHPPLSKFRVDVASDHPLARGLPASFEAIDELYLIELDDVASTELLLTTQLEKDPSPPGFGFVYDRDTSALEDGRTRALGYTRRVGAGGVAYVALGHCHSPLTNSQPFVDPSLAATGETPLVFHGSWELPPFQQLLRNALDWGTATEPTP